MGTVDCWGDVANGGDEELESILSILDFPMEGLEGDGFIGDWDAAKSADYLGPIPSDVMMNSSPLVLPPTLKSDATQLKQPSSYLPENTIRPFINKSAEAREPNGVFQMQSPISVLESNGPIIKSCTTKRNRSKRPKPPSLNPWLSLLPLSSGKARKRVRERRKPPQILGENSSDKGDNPLYSVTKRCAHCQVTKTPQWREGPMGPKTLCNACGVRYRSGRLFPEYRPAASPTFVAAIHSNSHRKVVEMRSKAVKVEEVALAMSPEMEFVPMSSYLFDDPV